MFYSIQTVLAVLTILWMFLLFGPIITNIFYKGTVYREDVGSYRFICRQCLKILSGPK